MNKINYREIVGTIEVSTTEDGEMKNEKYYLPTEPIEQDAAFLSIKAGCTVNMGNYNSGRVDISLMYPCKPEEIDKVYESVKNWVDNKLALEYRELQESAKSGKG